jgi:hypothetical protein
MTRIISTNRQLPCRRRRREREMAARLHELGRRNAEAWGDPACAFGGACETSRGAEGGVDATKGSKGELAPLQQFRSKARSCRRRVALRGLSGVSRMDLDKDKCSRMVGASAYSLKDACDAALTHPLQERWCLQTIHVANPSATNQHFNRVGVMLIRWLVRELHSLAERFVQEGRVGSIVAKARNL